MKKQKMVSLLLTAAIMFSLFTTVFAAGDTTVPTEITTVDAKGTEIQIPSKLNLPVVKVTLGAPAEVCVNPYKMTYTHPQTTPPTSSTDSLIAAPTWIKSNSTLQMNITAKPTATVQGDIVISETDVTEGITGDKKIYMAMFMDKVTGVGTAGENAALAYDATGSSNKAVVTGSGKNTVSIKMDAAASEADTDATYASFLIKGHSCGGNWSRTADKITLTVVFNIQPQIGGSTP